jgi:hypothetical protein
VSNLATLWLRSQPFNTKEAGTVSDYPGKQPLHTRFKKGRSGNPRGRRAKNLPALWSRR